MNNNDLYTVYKHTSPSGKVYIGMTSMNPEKRWSNGYGYRTQVFYHAIKKYGWNNIKHEILFERLTKEEAEQKEIELIAYYKSNQKEHGYNVDNGGNCVGKISDSQKQKMMGKNNPMYGRKGEKHPLFGKKHTKETKEKMRKNHADFTGENHPKYGTKLSEATRKKISEHHADVSGCNSPMYGKNHSEETKRKISESKIGKKLPPFTAEHRNKIGQALKIPVAQYSKDGDLIQVHDSAVDIERKFGFNKSCIRDCCRGNQKTAYGYIWKYIQDAKNIAEIR